MAPRDLRAPAAGVPERAPGQVFWSGAAAGDDGGRWRDEDPGKPLALSRALPRVSGYPLDEMVGKAHNIVRHPDMSRAIFQPLWDTIGAGPERLSAHVANVECSD